MVNSTAIIQLLGCTLVSARSMWMEDSGSSDEGRIINGEDVKYGDFKFVVSIQRNRRRQHLCGGTILTKNWVLTAAHCCVIGPPRHFNIYFGSVNRDTGGSFRLATRFIIHEEYNMNEYYMNDICLVRVFPPFIFSENTRQVTLPNPNMPVPGGTRLVAAGWGYITAITSEQKVPQRMRKVDLVAMENDKCEEETGLDMTPGYLCTHGLRSGQGICQGDSGGPLMKDNIQIGISSFIFYNCSTPQPDVFTRVPHYINWIEDKLGLEAQQLRFSN